MKIDQRLLNWIYKEKEKHEKDFKENQDEGYTHSMKLAEGRVLMLNATIQKIEELSLLKDEEFKF